MKSQVHNQGDLKELKVNIEKSVFDAISNMAENTKIPLDDLVVIALKRFRVSHGDYLGKTPRID